LISTHQNNLKIQKILIWNKKNYIFLKTLLKYKNKHELVLINIICELSKSLNLFSDRLDQIISLTIDGIWTNNWRRQYKFMHGILLKRIMVCLYF